MSKLIDTQLAPNTIRKTRLNKCYHRPTTKGTVVKNSTPPPQTMSVRTQNQSLDKEANTQSHEYPSITRQKRRRVYRFKVTLTKTRQRNNYQTKPVMTQLPPGKTEVPGTRNDTQANLHATNVKLTQTKTLAKPIEYTISLPQHPSKIVPKQRLSRPTTQSNTYCQDKA